METTENFKWRSASRSVAYVDLALHLIAIFAFILFVIVYALVTPPDYKFTSDVIAIIIAVAILVLLSIAFAFWVIKLLLDATKEEADAEVALRKVKLWRNINIVFTILALIHHAIQLDYLATAAIFIIRGVFIFIVCKFIGELSKAQFLPV